MTTPIIDPATLTEEQREAIMQEYEHNSEMYDLGCVFPTTMGTMHNGKMELLSWLFGENFFKKGE